MIKLKPYSASILAFGGLLLAVMGIYFVLLRPSLLPEDLRYIKTTLQVVQDAVPGLSAWLQKVFWVMGSYIFTTGLLIMYVAQTSFRLRAKGIFAIILVAGITSIGSMTIINFILQSDFKWVLLAFTLSWFIAIALYLFHK